VVNHTPHRSVAGTGYSRDSLNGMLSVDDVIQAVTAIYLDEVDLKYIKVIHHPPDVNH
jgi:hypothetical protein